MKNKVTNVRHVYGQLTDRSIEWLISLSVDWFIGWLIDWLIDPQTELSKPIQVNLIKRKTITDRTQVGAPISIEVWQRLR